MPCISVGKPLLLQLLSYMLPHKFHMFRPCRAANPSGHKRFWQGVPEPLRNKGYRPCLPGWLGTQLHGRIVLSMTIVVRAVHFGHGLHAGTRPTAPIPIGRYPLFKRANLSPRSVSVARNEKDKVTGIEVKAAVLKPNGKKDARLVYSRLQKHRMKKIGEAAFGASRELRWISVTSLWLNLCQICHTA